MRRDKREKKRQGRAAGRVRALRAALKLSEWCRPPNLFPLPVLGSLAEVPQMLRAPNVARKTPG